MAIDNTYATDALNPLGKPRLVTALELYARVPKADGSGYDLVDVGTAQSCNLSESRNVTYNFVIGNINPSTARDLIPGPVTSSKLQMDMVALYTQNGIGLFSEDVKNPNIPGCRFAASIRYNTRPFDVIERWINPTTGNTVYEVVYTGCYINSQQSNRTMNAGDIRVMENLSIDFKETYIVPGENLASDVAGGSLGYPQQNNG